ncbi:AGAP009630-PA-like protein [Anopheles sinensis]|uniref:AGAP009630-PA-like protein n=1 Tax=Anopheles sinensis TaxID=74873 RepID=A0A084W1Y5_ANOSI|nr:AGAP009630-PA-like protein [Anopheles sinensis]
MGSEYFPGRTTPETWVGAGSNRMWEMKRKGGKNTPRFYAESNPRMNTPQNDGISDTDTEPLPDEDEYTDNRYSESEFHPEQEGDDESEVQEPNEQSVPVKRECSQAHIQVSRHPPSDLETASHLLHIDFVTDELEQFELDRPVNRRVGVKKLPGQQHNISFSRERVREIERTNQILLRRILSTRPTLQTQAGLVRSSKSTGSVNSSRVTSAALNRKKAQKKIAVENELLIRKGVGEKIGITIRRIEEGKLFICAVARRSPAYLAGLRFGDEILYLDGVPSPSGDLRRVRQLLEKNVRNSIRVHTKDRSGERYVTITRDAQRGYGFRFVNGEITFVRPNTSAQRSGLERRLQIVEVNGEVVAGMNDTDIEAVICANISTVTLCVVPTKVYRNLLARLISSSSYDPCAFLEI